MYSIILMTAMATTPETTQFNGFFRDVFSFRGSCHGLFHGRSCNGCDGGFGSRIRSLFNMGGCCGGCYGSSCHGRRERDRDQDDNNYDRRPNRYEQYGSCVGASCTGNSCFGSTYAMGSCFGQNYGSNMPYYGGDVWGGGSYGYGYGDSGMMNGPIINGPIINGPLGGYNGPMFGNPESVEPRAPQRPARPEIEESRNYNQSNGSNGSSGNSIKRDPNRGMIQLKAPLDGQVFADNIPVKMNSVERILNTPSLPAGQRYEYNFRYEYTKNGEKRSREKKIQVSAGSLSVCDFTDETTSQNLIPPASPFAPLNIEPKEHVKSASLPSGIQSGLLPASGKTPGLLSFINKAFEKSPVTENPKATPSAETNAKSSSETPVIVPTMPQIQLEASKPTPAKFAVKLPENATLYVDGKKNSKTGPLREFTTPTLPVGQEFKYELKVEVPGPHGYPQSVSTTVSFKAGDNLPPLDLAELLNSNLAK